ncbi:MAG: glycosyltransferase family 2 protein [Deltaproteobacteria bacterium]|nr:glycosyltransferase family 2 protein [Deltaproteobacteria bacterium]
MKDVTVVMPVYNEEACISDVIDDWKAALGNLQITYDLLILNDGSRDKTANRLAAYEGDPAVTVINKENSGHGPTILTGYHLAAANAEWVFQVDSDNEMRAEHFQKLWQERSGCAAVFGIRSAREQALPRRIVSFISRMAVSLCYGRGVQDVNCPFRLMRSDILTQLLQRIPPDTFAPNVAIAGLFVLNRHPVKNIAVPHSNRQTGEVSIKKWKLFKAALKSFLQTIRIRFRA